MKSTIIHQTMGADMSDETLSVKERLMRVRLPKIAAGLLHNKTDHISSIYMDLKTENLDIKERSRSCASWNAFVECQ